MNKCFATVAVAAVALLSACSGSDSKSADTSAADSSAVAQTETEGGEAKVVDLTLDMFGKQVLDLNADVPKYLGSRPCVIDFYATWCGPCSQMSPVVEKLSGKFAGKVDFYRVDIDKEEELASDVFGVTAVPTFVYIDINGSINTSMGASSESEMIANITKFCLDR